MKHYQIASMSDAQLEEFIKKQQWNKLDEIARLYS